jgi:hypothetical protein
MMHATPKALSGPIATMSGGLYALSFNLVVRIDAD